MWQKIYKKEAILDSPSSHVWIKGWFDGDYSAIPGVKRQSGDDSESTTLKITSGRLTKIELADGPPAVTDSVKILHQEEAAANVLLHAPDGQAWISPIQDIYIADWESDSTASTLGGGGPRVGRIVGWAYARVNDPRLSHKPKPNQVAERLQNHEDASTSNSSESKPVVTPSLGQSPEKNDALLPNNTADKNKQNEQYPSEQPPTPHPCKVCSWGKTLLFFIIVWIVCSIGWAFLAITPLLIRCFGAQIFRSAWTSSERRQLMESILFLLIGLGGFAYLFWSTFFDCSNAATIALILLGTLVALSFKTRFCWLITLLSFLWGTAILISCQGEVGTCRTLPEIGNATNQVISDTHNKVSQIFQPDRDSQEVSGHSSTADGWTRISVEEAEKRPDKFFLCPEKPEPRKEQKVIYMGESALFELNQYTLSETSEPQLTRLGKLILKYPHTNLVVIGHADKSPHIDGPEGNLAISEKRANSVVDWLTVGGYVQPDHIVAMGAGDRYPLFDTPNEFRGNRRVEIRIICPAKKL